MKRIVVMLIAAAVLGGGMLGAQGQQGVVEEITAEPREQADVSLAVLKGPTGFSLIKLVDEGIPGNDMLTLEGEVLPSPNEAVARMASGELDIAVLPTNLAAVLHNKGLPYTFAAVTGMGMNYMVSRTPDAFSSWDDIRGKELHVAAQGATPDYMTQFVLDHYGIVPGEDVELNYSVSNASQLAQMVIAEKADHAVLPEPFVTMAELKGKGVERVFDLQQDWSEIQNSDETYPMTVLVISNALIESSRWAVDEILAAAEDSIEWVNAHPGDAAKLIEKHGVLAAAMAEPAVPGCNLRYIAAADAKELVQDYLAVLRDFNPSSVGGELPDDSFYLE